MVKGEKNIIGNLSHVKAMKSPSIDLISSDIK